MSTSHSGPRQVTLDAVHARSQPQYFDTGQGNFLGRGAKKSFLGKANNVIIGLHVVNTIAFKIFRLDFFGWGKAHIFGGGDALALRGYVPDAVKDVFRVEIPSYNFIYFSI